MKLLNGIKIICEKTKGIAIMLLVFRFINGKKITYSPYRSWSDSFCNNRINTCAILHNARNYYMRSDIL